MFQNMNVKKYYKKIMNKKVIIRIVLILWLVFSLGYIARDQLLKFKAGALQEAYMAGRAESIYELMANLKNENCDPITIYAEEEEINVINMECLNPTKETAEEAQ